METGLKGKTVLITGGSTGIGKGIAIALAKEGVHIAIASRNPDSAVFTEIREYGVECFEIRADVSRESDCIRMVKEAIDKLGHLDMYVNNAAWTWHQPVTKITSESWYKTIDTNLSSCMWVCREVSKYMISRCSGSILIIGSTSRFNPAYGETSYRISKMGLKMLMQNLAIELAPYSIRVNMITPGHFKTKMTGNIPLEIEEKLKDKIPMGRFGNPIEIGNTSVLLLSDLLSAYTSGADCVIDGGLSLNPLDLLSPKEIIKLNK